MSDIMQNLFGDDLPPDAPVRKRGDGEGGSSPLRVAIYCRHSKNAADGSNAASSLRQLEVCRAWAESRGWQVVVEYLDESISGRSFNARPAMLRLQEDAKHDIFDLVLVADMTRYARNAANGVPAIAELFDLGLRVAAVGSGELSRETAMSHVIMAENGIRYACVATEVALKKRAEDGVYVTKPPYGYRMDRFQKGVLVQIEEEVEIIREVAVRIIAGEMPVEILRDLNRRGVRTRGGNLWSRQTLVGTLFKPGVLRNPLICGAFCFGRHKAGIDPKTGRQFRKRLPYKQWKFGHIPEAVIISPEDFATIQRTFATRKTAERRGPWHFLSGKCRCSECGGTVASVGIGRNGHFRMACKNNNRGDTSCDNTVRILRAYVEQVILERVQKLVSTGDLEHKAEAEYLRQRRERAKISEKDLTQAKRTLERVQERIDKLVEARLDGSLPPAWTDKKMGELEVERVDASRLHQDLASRARADSGEEGSIDRVRAGLSDIASVLREGNANNLSTAATAGLAAMLDTVTVTVSPSDYRIVVTGFLEMDVVVPVDYKPRPYVRREKARLPCRKAA